MEDDKGALGSSGTTDNNVQQQQMITTTVVQPTTTVSHHRNSHHHGIGPISSDMILRCLKCIGLVEKREIFDSVYEWFVTEVGGSSSSGAGSSSASSTTGGGNAQIEIKQGLTLATALTLCGVVYNSNIRMNNIINAVCISFPNDKLWTIYEVIHLLIKIQPASSPQLRARMPAALHNERLSTTLIEISNEIKYVSVLYHDYIKLFTKIPIQYFNTNVYINLIESEIPGIDDNDNNNDQSEKDNTADFLYDKTTSTGEIPETDKDNNNQKEKSSSSSNNNNTNNRDRLFNAAWKLAVHIRSKHQQKVIEAALCYKDAAVVPTFSRVDEVLSAAIPIAYIVALFGNYDENNNNNEDNNKKQKTDNDDNENVDEKEQTTTSTNTTTTTTPLWEIILNAANDIIRIEESKVSKENFCTEITNLAKTIQELPILQNINDNTTTKDKNDNRKRLVLEEENFLQSFYGFEQVVEKLIYKLPKIAQSMYEERVYKCKYIEESELVTSVDMVDNLINIKTLEGGVSSNKEPRVVSKDLLEKARSGLVTEIRPVTPAFITESMELNEFAVSVCFLELVKPSTKLIETINDDTVWIDLIVPMINKTLLKLLQEQFTEGKASRKAHVSVVSSSNDDKTIGEVEIQGELTPDKQLCKAIVAFYYHALEVILYCEKQRINNNNNIKSLILNPVFHRSLLLCCCYCIIKAIGYTQKLNLTTTYQHIPFVNIMNNICTTSPYEFLKVSETFIRALTRTDITNDYKGNNNNIGSPLILKLPQILVRAIHESEIHCIDSLLWARDNSNNTLESMTDKILLLQEWNKKDPDITYWPPPPLQAKLPDELLDLGKTEVDQVTYPNADKHVGIIADFRCISYIVRKLLVLAHRRIHALCTELRVPKEYPIIEQVWLTFRYLLRNHIYLLFDRHIDHWILCCIYGISRTVKYQPELKFAKIIDCYVNIRENDDGLNPTACQRIVRHIKITTITTSSSNDNNEQQQQQHHHLQQGMGNVITLYNKVFVPNMKEHLLNSTSLKQCTTVVAELQGSEGASNNSGKATSKQEEDEGPRDDEIHDMVSVSPPKEDTIQTTPTTKQEDTTTVTAEV